MRVLATLYGAGMISTAIIFHGFKAPELQGGGGGSEALVLVAFWPFATAVAAENLMEESDD